MPRDFLPTDMVLLRVQGHPTSVEPFLRRLAAAPVCGELQVSIVRNAWAEHSGTLYIYLALPFRLALSKRTLGSFAELSDPGIPITVSRLALMQSLPGASRGEQPAFHYVVETTPAAGWEVELQSWYAAEHLPGLANVPGCVQAQRFWSHDDGPRSFACYDLTTKQALESPAWLAVRHTPWSDRVRAHFTNTVRTMFTIGK